MILLGVPKHAAHGIYKLRSHSSLGVLRFPLHFPKLLENDAQRLRQAVRFGHRFLQESGCFQRRERR